MAKTIYYHLVGVCLVFQMLSCAEDRTYQYENLTQHNHWIYEEMSDKYLWGDSLADFEPEWKKYFAKPDEFLRLLTDRSKQNDRWSYVEIDTANVDSHGRGYFNAADSYGFDFVLTNDPTGLSTRSMARVTTVYPDSPAERGGLVRGDFICAFNSFKITANNLSKLQSGVGRTLEVRHLALDEQELRFFWRDTVDVVLEASQRVEDRAFPVSTLIRVEDRLVGYLMCTRLLAGPVEGNTVYRDELDLIMAQMKAANVDEMVLDMRLCNYGTMDMAQRLASYVVRPDARADAFARTRWNARYAANDRVFHYDLSVDNLGLNRVYVLTGDYTQGAAEWLIYALRHAMGEENVPTVGKATKGQSVMTQKVSEKFHVRLFPVVASVADGANNLMSGSIAPTVPFDELEYMILADYGSPDESLLQTALIHMIGGQNVGGEDFESDKTADTEGVE